MADCADCGRKATDWCEGCKKPVCRDEAALCELFHHRWRRLRRGET